MNEHERAIVADSFMKTASYVHQKMIEEHKKCCPAVMQIQDLVFF